MRLSFPRRRLRQTDELGADRRAHRMRTAAVRAADWLQQNLEPVSNGWFTRRANPEGKIYRLSPDGGQDKFWQTSAGTSFRMTVLSPR